MKFKVSLINIKLYGFHGVFSNEKKNGQKFELDVEYIYEHKNDLIQVLPLLGYEAIQIIIKLIT